MKTILLRNLLLKGWQRSLLILLFFYSLNLQGQERCCPTGVTFLQGSEVVFCESVGDVEIQVFIGREDILNPCKLNVDWFKDDSKLDVNSSRYEIDSLTGVLRIKDISASDAGTYTIQVGLDTCASDTAMVDIVINSDEEIMIETSTEDCQTCFVVPNTFSNPQWRKNGMLVGSSLKFCTAEEGTYLFEASGSGCPVQKEVSVGTIESPSIQFTESNPVFCEGTTATISATAENADTYRWELNGEEVASTLTFDAFEEGVYSLFASSSVTGCSTGASINLTEIELPVLEDQSLTVTNGQAQSLDLGVASPIELNLAFVESLNVNNNAAGVEGNNVIIINPTLETTRASGTISYTIQASRAECEGDPVKLVLKVLPSVEGPFIPEIYSPNGDGMNDEWEVVFPNEEDAQNHSVVIFNRSGGKVYDRGNMSEKWNGANCQNGVYYYLITNTETKEIYQGAVTILGKR